MNDKTINTSLIQNSFLNETDQIIGRIMNEGCLLPTALLVTGMEKSLSTTPNSPIKIICMGQTRANICNFIRIWEPEYRGVGLNVGGNLIILKRKGHLTQVWDFGMQIRSLSSVPYLIKNGLCFTLLFGDYNDCEMYMEIIQEKNIIINKLFKIDYDNNLRLTTVNKLGTDTVGKKISLTDEKNKNLALGLLEELETSPVYKFDSDYVPIENFEIDFENSEQQAIKTRKCSII